MAVRLCCASLVANLALPFSLLPQRRGLDIQWLFQARGDFTRATTALTQDVKNTDLDDRDASRLLNDRLMKVSFLQFSFAPLANDGSACRSRLSLTLCY